MIKTLLIEDELTSRNALKDELKVYNLIEIVGECDSVRSAVSAVNELKPELIFLDIHLKDGSGFDVLDKVSHKDFKVIFVTAYDNYAIKAFKYSAIDYILKPIGTKEIKHVLDKISNSQEPNLQLNDIIKGLQIINTKRLPIPHSEGISIYNMEDIIRFQADGNYTIVYFSNGSKLLTSKTLKEFEDLLLDFGFERVHHGHLVNIKHVLKYMNKDGGYLVLSDKSNIPISQRKKTTILKLFEKLI